MVNKTHHFKQGYNVIKLKTTNKPHLGKNNYTHDETLLNNTYDQLYEHVFNT